MTFVGLLADPMHLQVLTLKDMLLLFRSRDRRTSLGKARRIVSRGGRRAESPREIYSLEFAGSVRRVDEVEMDLGRRLRRGKN